MSKRKESSSSISDDDSTSSCNKTCFVCGETPCCLLTYKEELRMTFEGCKIHEEQYEVSLNEKKRFYCYREFTRIVYGYLGKGNRVEVAPCIIKTIHEIYPDKGGKYIGFKDSKQDSDFSE